MRPRASLSSNSAACAGTQASCSAKSNAPADKALPVRERVTRSPPGRASLDAPRSLLALIDEVVTTVLGPRALVVSGVPRLFLAEAHRFDLRFGRAEQHHHFLYGVGATLSKRDVVFAASTLVGIALDGHAAAPCTLQVTTMRLDERLVLVPDGGAAEID